MPPPMMLIQGGLAKCELMVERRGEERRGPSLEFPFVIIF